MAKVYTTIPGVGTGRGKLQLATRSRLFQGPDHFLVVQSTGLTEEYRRIFYRDVRWVEIRPTRGFVVQAIISSVVTFLLALLYFAYVPAILVVVLCAPTAIWFVVNLLGGPTCDCYISTNVQTLLIPAPGRHKKVAPFIGFLRDKVAAAAPVSPPQPA
jgi:hypothetical protein